MAAFSNISVIRQLAALLAAHGVTRCIVCPGSRNAALASTLDQHPAIECRAVTDERSAAFQALGWAGQSHCPVALCITSGSAVLNAHPAVAEACYRNLPLLILSADRPSAWIGQQDGQTLPQPEAFGSLVRFAANLPEGDDEETAWHRNRLINEALLELTHRGGGPTHLNVPLREPLFGFVESLPEPQRVIRRLEMGDMSEREEKALLAVAAGAPRRLVLLGQNDRGIKNIADLQKKRFVCVGEHLSNTDGLDQPRPEALLRGGAAPVMSPDLLITCGGCILSKRLKQLLRTYPPREHWHISRNGAVVDTFGCLTLCLEGEPADFFELMASFADEGDADYAALWRSVPPSPFAPYGGIKLTGELLQSLPRESVLHLGNSSAVRFAQLFPLPPGVRVECNRGVNGIEGSLSAAVGFARGDTRLNVLIIGDLSFFYDMNALWQHDGGENLRILLLNNSGGGIFDTIPGLPSDRKITGENTCSALPWGECCGFDCFRVQNELDWETAKAALLGSGKRPVLVEAIIDSKIDAEILHQYYTPATTP